VWACPVPQGDGPLTIVCAGLPVMVDYIGLRLRRTGAAAALPTSGRPVRPSKVAPKELHRDAASEHIRHGPLTRGANAALRLKKYFINDKL